MEIICDSNKCTGCGACAQVCKKNAIIMKPEKTTGFEYPQIDSEKCIDCGACQKVCPILDFPAKGQIREIYAACSLNEKTKKNSTSGAIFYELAKYFVERGGIVYGTAYNRTFSGVEIIRIDTVADLKYLQGSKYIQSYIKKAYLQIKEDLLNGKDVLFAGVPCQCAALKKYMQHKNLYLIELLCSHIGSPTVFSEYIKSLEKKHKSNVKSINMRTKQSGWKKAKISVDFCNGKSYIKPLLLDPYSLGYALRLLTRKSCSDCKFAEEKRVSDIVLGDFWGVSEKDFSRKDIKNGISLVATVTLKGDNLLAGISDKLKKYPRDLKEAQKENKPLYAPAGRSAQADDFIKDFEKYGYLYVEKKYLRRYLFHFKVQIKKRIRRLKR